MLKRSQRIRSQEDLILPLYEPLAKSADEGDFRASFFSVLAALAVASSDTMWEKLTFIINLFDTNGNKVGKIAHYVGSTRARDGCRAQFLKRRAAPYGGPSIGRGSLKGHTQHLSFLSVPFPSFVPARHSVHGQARSMRAAGNTCRCTQQP